MLRDLCIRPDQEVPELILYPR